MEIIKFLLNLAAKGGLGMSTLQVSNNNISLLDALWTLFKSQPKVVRDAFARRLRDEEKVVSKSESHTAVRKAKVVHKSYSHSDQELEELLKSNPALLEIPEANVKNIISGSSGKVPNNFIHWL